MHILLTPPENQIFIRFTLGRTILELLKRKSAQTDPKNDINIGEKYSYARYI